MIFGLDNWNLYPITGIRCAYKTAPAVTRRDGWCCLMVLGVCLANADGKGYRAGVAARVGGSVRLDKGQGCGFSGFTALGGQDRAVGG